MSAESNRLYTAGFSDDKDRIKKYNYTFEFSAFEISSCGSYMCETCDLDPYWYN